MFNIIKKSEPKTVKIDNKTLLEYLRVLQITEDKIHFLSKHSLFDEIKLEAANREKIAKELLNEITLLSKYISQENTNSILNKIIIHIREILKILEIQKTELNDETILSNNLTRTIAIDGNNPSGNSQLTSKLFELSNLLNSQNAEVLSHIVQIQEDLEDSNFNDAGLIPPNSLSGYVRDVRPKDIRQRFIISDDGETIHDNVSNITWDRDWRKRVKMNWYDAIKINDNGFKLPSRDNFRSLYCSVNGLKHKIDLSEIGFLFSDDQTYFLTSDVDEILTANVYLFSFDRYNPSFTSSNSKYSQLPIVCCRLG